MSTSSDGSLPPDSSALGPNSLERVLRWSWRRHLAVLREDALVGPIGLAEIDRRIALGALDLAAGELLAACCTSREGRRRAAEALTGACIRALLSPRGSADPTALSHLEVARRGFSGNGVAWAGLLRYAERAHHEEASPFERGAAGAARWASHLALGDPAAECGRLAFGALAEAFEPEHATEPLAIALAHLERTLADRQITADQLRARVEADQQADQA